MRWPTPEEERRWAMLLQAFGHYCNKPSSPELGRFHRWDTGEGGITVRLLAPLLAWRHTEDLQPKVPPIRFDRTPDGEIIIPGRWWQWALETLGEMEQVHPRTSRIAAVAARRASWGDALVPATTETIAVMAPNERGEPVLYEAIPPETPIEIISETLMKSILAETEEEGWRP